MHELQKIHKANIIKKPKANVYLAHIFRINGMEDFIHQCYPDFIAFVDQLKTEDIFQSPSIKIIRENKNELEEFCTLVYPARTRLWWLFANSDKKLSDFKLINNKLREPVMLTLTAPELGNNININFPVELENATKIGNNCHFTELRSVSEGNLTTIGNNFSAEVLYAPNLIQVGNKFTIKQSLTAKKILHQSQILSLEREIKKQYDKITEYQNTTTENQQQIEKAKTKIELINKQIQEYKKQNIR